MVSDFNMKEKKSAALTIRIRPKVKQALEEAAMKDSRSVSNLLEVLVLSYCEENGIVVDQNQAGKTSNKRKRNP